MSAPYYTEAELAIRDSIHREAIKSPLLHPDEDTIQFTRREIYALECYIAKTVAGLRTILTAAERLADEAESYVGIGFDTFNESAKLMDAIKEFRA